jgi:pyridoxamine 5'-phosphate oxidase
MNDDLEAAAEPWALFAAWFAEASASEPSDANAMQLGTAGRNGLPDIRTVLMKAWDERGFVFYTNTNSAKAAQLKDNPQAAVLFHWKSLKRQVRARGPVEAVTEAEADAYFATRSRGSRIGAWVSQQSAVLASRAGLEADVASFTAEHVKKEDIARPPFWSGFRLLAQEIEFWREGNFRLHDRIRFTREAGGWKKERLYP